MMNIIILDHALQQKAVLSTWVEFEFNQKLNEQGSFTLIINANDKQANQIELGQIIYLEPEVCGYITSIEITSEKDKANELMEISGIEVKDIIKSRITYPPQGEEAFVYTQKKSDEIVMDLIDKHLINPADSRKHVPIFKLGGSSSAGSVIDFSTRLKQLDGQIYELLQKDKLGLKCMADLKAKQIEFEVFKGLDRTIAQNENPRAIFSMGYGTLNQSLTYLGNETYRSVGYIGGTGEGAERQIIELPSDNTFSGLERWETFVDMRDVKTEAELTSRGGLALADYGKTHTVRGEIKRSDKMTYALGDFVTVADRKGNYENVQITGMSRLFKGSHIQEHALTFGRGRTTIAQAMTRRFSGLNNILTK